MEESEILQYCSRPLKAVTAVTVKSTVFRTFRAVPPCSSVVSETVRHVREHIAPYLQGLRNHEKQVAYLRATRRCKPEDCTLPNLQKSAAG
jgi:hypothetical protein